VHLFVISSDTMHGKCKILRLKVVVLRVMKLCTDWWTVSTEVHTCATVLDTTDHFKSTTNNCEDPLMMVPMECLKHVGDSMHQLCIYSSPHKVDFTSWLCMKQAILKHEKYYFTAVIFKHNPQYTNAFLSSWQFTYSLFRTVPLFTLSTAFLSV
jgi:hypothetical protein